MAPRLVTSALLQNLVLTHLLSHCFRIVEEETELGAQWYVSRNPLSSVQSLSHVWLFVTPWIEARQASLSITNSRSSLRLTSKISLGLRSIISCCNWDENLTWISWWSKWEGKQGQSQSSYCSQTTKMSSCYEINDHMTPHLLQLRRKRYWEVSSLSTSI